MKKTGSCLFMRHSPRLARVSSTAVALGRTALHKTANQTYVPERGGAEGAMLLMKRARGFLPSAYLSDTAAHRSVNSAVARRKRRYEPYSWILQRYIERGFVDLDALILHPDAPSPMEVLLSVMRQRTPCQGLTERALQAALSQPRLTSSSGAASFALQSVSHMLKRYCPHLYNIQGVRVLLCQALLSDRLFTDAIEILEAMPDAWITPELWLAVMEAAGDGKVPHSPLLWRLLTLGPRKNLSESRVVQTGQRILAEVRGVVVGAAAKTKTTHRAMNGVSNRSSNNSGVFGVGGRDGEAVENMATLSTFEVRPASLVHLTQDAGRSEWCQLSTAEIGYAEQHYMLLRDGRGWGKGILHEDGDNSAEGVVYGLGARLASRLMLRANVSFSGQSSPLIALHVLRRYLNTCHALKRQKASSAAAALTAEKSSSLQVQSVMMDGSKSGSVDTLEPTEAASLASSAMCEDFEIHPSPFLLFFKIIREARDVVPGGTDHAVAFGQPQAVTHSGLPMIHWGVVWRFFQILNRECPLWYTIIPEEAGDLSHYVIDVLCRGADPWMTLNVARAVSSRHIVDGLDMSLWLLHRLDASHHTDEAKEVARKVFRWLLVDIGVHLLPQLHHQLIPASRVLIRLGLHEELRQLYNAVLDNVYVFTEEFRSEFVHVMADLVCPSCNSILPEQDVFADRSCPLCFAVVPPKDPDSLPSFQLSNEHVSRLREKRKVLRIKDRQRLHASIRSWSKSNGGGGNSRDNANERISVSSRLPADASTVFKKEILGDTVPLIPGVPVNKHMPLFQLDGNEYNKDKKYNQYDDMGNTKVPFDLHAAMEESMRRLQRQEAARRHALAQRGVSLPARQLGTSSSLLSSYSSFTGLQQQRWWGKGEQEGRPQVLVHMRLEGPWICVWCQERNSEWTSRVHCGACGAETGPSAPWRHFAYAAPGDVMAEICARVANAEERPIDAIVTAYLLMVYRRAFLLRATPHDAERIDQLVRRLCSLHERVLAGYVYTRFVPSRSRCKGETLHALAQLFGCNEADYTALSTQELQHDEEKFFQTIFSPSTCKVCLGTHAWKMCPIVTRDFSSVTRTSINMTPEEKQRAVLQQLQQVVELAVQRGADNSRLVLDAYLTFVKFPYRELFAEIHSRDVNRLSILLSRYHQYRRAAFVLCHIPLHLRDDKTYLGMVHYFNVPVEEARELLSKRSPLGVEDETHPNFVQVTLTCCMCLDGQHASFECPRMVQWLREVDALTQHPQQARRLRAQVDGWTSAGPERLHAFYRFLLERVDTFQEDLCGDDDEGGNNAHGADADAVGTEAVDATAVVTQKPLRRIDMEDPVVYAINKTITKLAGVGHEKGACRLYVRAPVAFVSRQTTSAMLRMHRYSDDGIRTLLGSSSSSNEETALGVSSEAARSAAVPMKSHCLLCFDSCHAYMDCPELAAQFTTAARLEYVARQVGGIRCTVDGIRAAAAFVYHMYNLGNLTGDLLRAHPSLVRALLRLVRRCFATGLVAAGTRVLRRIPAEMVPPARIYTDLWRAAGLSEKSIEDRRAQLLALYAAEGLAPRIDDPPARQTHSNLFVSNLSHALHDDLCRHCYQHGHTLATCSVFHAEVSFGRDYVAAYRMGMMSEQLDRDWQDAYLLKLADFFCTHRLFMPYYIVGVTNALNAIAAMWSFRGEPGIAMRHLLNIPPAYRRRQSFRHILHALHVPTAEVTRLLSKVQFSPDEVLPSSSRRREEPSVLNSSSYSGDGSGSGAAAQHLLMPKPAIRDVAMTAVFNHIPEAIAALEKSEERMAAIRRRNATQRVLVDHNGENTPKLNLNEAVKQTSKTSTTTAIPSSAVVETSPALRVMQSGDILTLREDFDPVLTELEVAVGMKLGSRHVLFTSAVDILSAAAKATNDGTREEHAVPSPSLSSFSAAASATSTNTTTTPIVGKAKVFSRSDPLEETDVVTVFTKEQKQRDFKQSGKDEGGRRSSNGSGVVKRPSPSSLHAPKQDAFCDPRPPDHHGGQHHYSKRPRFHERQQQQQQQNQQKNQRWQRDQKGGSGRPSSRHGHR